VFGDKQVCIPARARDFHLLQNAQNIFGTLPASYATDTKGSLPGVKWLGHEADNSLPTSG